MYGLKAWVQAPDLMVQRVTASTKNHGTLPYHFGTFLHGKELSLSLCCSVSRYIALSLNGAVNMLLHPDMADIAILQSTNSSHQNLYDLWGPGKRSVVTQKDESQVGKPPFAPAGGLKLVTLLAIPRLISNVGCIKQCELWRRHYIQLL